LLAAFWPWTLRRGLLDIGSEEERSARARRFAEIALQKTVAGFAGGVTARLRRTSNAQASVISAG